ncbi:hypothetical protein L6452_40473 [Arctium lappa]|uniref:Uncharacterized protein n=1 Tax=Arctium lappa TaxID=4217 RepID=A0ACB8XMV9_ARCLA|nr:hypothetical protein L6452_40473 [Arctium lappa]
MPSSEALSISMDEMPPVLYRGEYDKWRIHFLDFIDKHDLGDYIRLSQREGKMETPTDICYYMGENGRTEHLVYTIPFKDYTDEQRKRFEADKLSKAFILQGISEEISKEISVSLDSKKATGKQLWEHLEKIMTGTKMSSRVKFLETENSELKRQISDLEVRIFQIQQAASVESSEEQIEHQKDTNAELQKQISDLEQKHAQDKSEVEKSFAKKFSEFSRKCADEKKEVKLKCIKLSQQVSEFQKKYLAKETMLRRDLKKKEACLRLRSKGLLPSYLNYLRRH